MLQTLPNMTEVVQKINLNQTEIEYRFAQRMFLETKGNLNFQIVGISRLYN